MGNASWELQQAIYASLTSDDVLAALLGGTRIYDEVRVRNEFPYITFATATVRDWSTGTEVGAEHALVLHVFSRAAGRKEAAEIMAALEVRLHGAALELATHRLVNLRHEASEVRRTSDGEAFQGVVRLRAVTERDD